MRLLLLLLFFSCCCARLNEPPLLTESPSIITNKPTFKPTPHPYFIDTRMPTIEPTRKVRRMDIKILKKNRSFFELYLRKR